MTFVHLNSVTDYTARNNYLQMKHVSTATEIKFMYIRLMRK